ncbi:MAG: DUF4166 domain-containing protein [Xanthomonadaceae bacterium]|nr:DUF4166 domain-containing protein [Xanthomonadaceae bacterium]
MKTAPPLFRRLLGDAIDRTPDCVQRLHHRPGTVVYRGDVTVERGATALARLCGWATALPPAGDGPIEVEIVADERREIWTRRVGKHAMCSTLWDADGLLCERLGLVTFGFRVGVEDGAIVWRVVRVRALGILPLPVRAFSGVEAREFEQDGRYRFDVRAALPFAGMLVHYRGALDVP